MDPKFECAMCGKDLLKDPRPIKTVVIDNSVETICAGCNNKYTPDEIKSVTVVAEMIDKKITKEYDIILFMTNQFTEKDIRNYNSEENLKLTKYLKKLFDLKKEEVSFKLSINLLKKRCNHCELCDKMLDYQDSIHFLTGKKNPIQVCKACNIERSVDK
jgi:hypothetical protein